jgi:hypothetical protein
MDADRFDALAKILAERRSRRRAIEGLAAVALGALGWGEARSASALACRTAGALCRENADCCSGLCARDAFGRRTCQCKPPAVACGRSCVDPATAFQSDPTNCGACGHRCPAALCQRATCSNGQCGLAPDPAAAGTACDDHNSCTTGDVCDAEGRCVGTPVVCTAQDACHVAGTCDPISGACSNPPAPAGTSCGQNGGVICDGAGQCVQCLKATDCPGQDTECATRTCTAGTCGFVFAPAGTPTSSQTAGDCQKNVCDGAGNVVSQVDDTDLPADDGNQCTAEVCTNGVPSYPSLPPGAPCSQNGGVICDGQGTCLQCLSASDCPGQDTECQTRTCNGGTCGFFFAPAGTTCGPIGAMVCDGAGNCVA